jgi:hypothetical protein
VPFEVKVSVGMFVELVKILEAACVGAQEEARQAVRCMPNALCHLACLLIHHV